MASRMSMQSSIRWVVALGFALTTVVAPAYGWLTPQSDEDGVWTRAVPSGGEEDIFRAGGVNGLGISRVDGKTGKVRWVTETVGDLATDVVRDGGISFIAVGRRGTQLVALSVAQSSGQVRWETVLDDGGTEPSIVLVHDNDVVVTASGMVAKLSGVDGSVLWRRDFPDVSHNDVDAVFGGDVVFAGRGSSPDALRAFRLAAADGSTVWTQDYAADVVDVEVGVAGGGDAFLVGRDATTGDVTVIKAAIATGAFQWQFVGPGAPIGRAQLLFFPDDPDEQDLMVKLGSRTTRIDAPTGAQTWTTTAGGSVARWAFLVGGDLIGTGAVAGPGDQSGFAARLSSATGALMWQQRMVRVEGGGPSTPDTVRTGDSLVAVGDPTWKFASRLSASKLFIQQDVNFPAKNKLVFASKDRRLMIPYASGGLEDPSVEGGVFQLSNSITGETVDFPLPAAGWSAVLPGKSTGDRWIYRDPTGASACAKIVLSTGKGLKMSCRGPALAAFTLDEISQQNLRVTLRLGTGTPDICFDSFLSTVVLNTGTGPTGRGIVNIKNLGPAPVCIGGF
jgi:hypothetical protein